MDEFRLLVSVEREATLVQCSAFTTSPGGHRLSFPLAKPIEVPRSLLCAGPHRADFPLLAIVERYGAVPCALAFEIQVTCAALARELRRRQALLEQASALRPRIVTDGWRSLSPGPGPRGSNERLFDMDNLSDTDDDDNGGTLPTGGRFGLWLVHMFDIDPDSPRQQKTPPLERGRSGSVGSLDALKIDALRRRTSSPPPLAVVTAGALDRIVPISWRIGGGPGGSNEDAFERAATLTDAVHGSFALELDGMRLHCGVRRELVDNRFALFIDELVVTVRVDSPIAPVFDLASDE
jgi:hypothetical protein